MIIFQSAIDLDKQSLSISLKVFGYEYLKFWVVRSAAALGVLMYTLAGSSSLTWAAPVTFVYEGVVSNNFGGFSGQTVTVEYIFDTDTPGGSLSSSFGVYNDTRSSFTATISGYSASDSSAQIILFDGSARDDFIIGSDTITGPDIGLAVLSYLEFNFQEGEGSIFSSDALPTVQPDPGDFGGVFLRLNFFGGSSTSGFIQAGNFSIVEASTSISEPSFTALLGLGAAVFVARRRKRSL